MKRKKEEATANTAEAGIRVLTVALFIILLAFFIVLNSMAVVDDRSVLAALGSLTGSFGILPGGVSPTKDGEVRVISSYSVPVDEQTDEYVEISETGKDGQGVVDVRGTPQGKIIRIQDKVMFDEESYRIKPGAYEFLKKVCDILNQGDYPVEITGHTDDLPRDVEKQYSHQELSSLRALEVFKFCVVIGKVLPTRIIAYGCGKNRPIASNDTRITRAKNRRVDISMGETGERDLKDIYQKNQSAFAVFKSFVFRVLD